jgi:putative transposon-encoded protein
MIYHQKAYIYMYILVYMANIKIEKGKIELKDDYEFIFEKVITKFGNGAKIDAPKDMLGRKVYVIVRKN